MQEVMARSGGPIVVSGHFPQGDAVTRCYPLWSMVVTLGGACELQVRDGPTVTIQLGDVHLIGPGVSQSRRVVDDRGWSAMSVTFAAHSHWPPWLRLPERAPGLPVVHLSDGRLWARVRRRFREMVRLYERAGPLFREQIMNRAEDVLLLLRQQCLAANIRPMDERISRAIEHLRLNLQRTISVEELAHHCHMSRSRFAELFREQVGHPPATFANLCRMDRAKDLLLLTNDTIAEIAAEVGVPDAKHFSRLFRQFTSVTPTAFRRERRAARKRGRNGGRSVGYHF